MAQPLFIVYLVLDRDLRAEGMPNRNWSVIDCDDLDSMAASFACGQLPSQRWAWITSASLKDPNNPRLCRPGQTNLQIVTGAPASHDFWDVDAALTQGPRYQERKRQLRDRAIESAERAIPGIGAAIAYEETATSIMLERYLRSTGGTSYGIAATPRQFGIGGQQRERRSAGCSSPARAPAPATASPARCSAGWRPRARSSASEPTRPCACSECRPRPRRPNESWSNEQDSSVELPGRRIDL